MRTYKRLKQLVSILKGDDIKDVNTYLNCHPTDIMMISITFSPYVPYLIQFYKFTSNLSHNKYLIEEDLIGSLGSVKLCNTRSFQVINKVINGALNENIQILK